MKVYQVFQEVEVQTEVRFVRFDFAKNERIDLTCEEAWERIIAYMYVDDGVLFFECENYDDE